MNIGQDVAVLFENQVFLGRINRIRRKYTGGGWNDYILPVDIQVAKEQQLLLYFDLTWYVQQPGHAEPAVYKFGIMHTGTGRQKKRCQDTREVELASIICPVTLEQTGTGNSYNLPQEQQDVIDLSRGGHTSM